MRQYYAINKTTEKLSYISGSLLLLFKAIETAGEDKSDFYITEDIGVKYISRIVYVDNVCVYNNINFWVNVAPSVIENYESHTVIDVLGDSVDKNRFETEYYSNTSRIASMDGAYGESEYNIEVGKDFIALFHRECTLTDFQTITPMQILAKLSEVNAALQTGSFREAVALLNNIERDDFLTEARIKKYADMLLAADAITYAGLGETVFVAGATE